MSDFQYLGVENNKMGFREISTGIYAWLPIWPEGPVELLDGDRVQFLAVGDWKSSVWSIREGRRVE